MSASQEESSTTASCSLDGLEVFFVKQPPHELQLECSICLQLLAEPCILNCDCGASFCKKCIQVIKKNWHPCPLCNQNFDIILPNKQLQRTLNGLLIYCSRSSDGCSWTNQLVKLNEHLNQRPSKEMRLDGCGFTDVACQYCNKLFPRKEMKSHENETCPNKPYTCEYCGHSSVLDDITQNHWPVCLMIPVPCPYECQENPQRQNLNNHVEEDCSLVPVDCEFAYAGCCVDITRGGVADHMRCNVVQHMTLMSRQHRKEVKAVEVALKKEVEALKKENKHFRDECLSLREDNNSLRQEVKSLRATSAREDLRKKIGAESKCRYQLECLTNREDLETKQQAAAKPPPGPLPPVELIVKNIRSLRQLKNSWVSKPFYSRSHYKMVLQVYPYGNGDGYGTHISVFICIIKGEYDSQLKWPFVGEVTITLINQKLERHETNTLNSRDNSFGKRQFSCSCNNGHGWPEFMDYRYILLNYLKDDCIVFRIDDIK